MNQSQQRDGVERKEFNQQDARLDWRSTHDERSQNFPIRQVLGDVTVEPKTWRVGPVLDQGAEGACVGFGWTAELMSSPRPDPDATKEIGDPYAKSVYYDARRIDEWPGESYEGTSVLAGAKVLQGRELISGYRWCFSVEDVRDTICAPADQGGGPVVIGIPWLYNMYWTRPSGLVEVSGEEVGGHCLLVYGFHPNIRLRGEDWENRFKVFKWRNSWSEHYGRNGSGYVRYEDLRDLLAVWGEACVPIGRSLTRLSSLATG